MIATRGADVSTGVRHQATFEVLQTAPPATLASQLAAASSASAASGAATAASTGPTSVIAGIPPALATSIVLGASDLGSIPLILTGSLSTITDLAGLTAAAASVSNAQASLSSVISSLSAAGSSIPPALLSSLSDLSSSNAGLGSTESSVVSSIARTRGPSVLQNYDDDNGDPVPKWAIALIAVLGLLALLAALVAIWFCLRRMRRKQRESQYMETKGGESIPSSTIPTREASATGLGLAGAGEQEKDRPLSESFSDGTGNTGGRMSSTSAPFTSTSAGLPARGGSATSGAFATAAGVGAIAALASREKRSDSPAHRTLERSNTDRTDSPHHFHPHHQDNTPPSATRFTGGAIPTKPSLRSLGTNASTGAGTIAPYDAAIMADAYRNVLRKPEFPHRGDDSSGSGENDSTPKDETTTPAVSEGQQGRMPHTPKASGTTTPMAFGDSGSEGEHHSGRNRGISTSTEGSRDALAGRATYGGRESDEEDGNEANELIKHELASEGTSVRR